MDRNLFIQALLKYCIGLILIIFLLFLPAGTFFYWNAWLFIALLFIPITIIGTVLMIKNPKLLKERLNSNEREENEKKVIFLSRIIFLSEFIIAGLNYRYHWKNFPNRE